MNDADTRVENALELAALGLDPAAILALQQAARLLHRWSERSCNYGLTPRQETRMSNLITLAHTIANNIGLEVYHQGDPRGWPLYLYDPVDPRLSGCNIDSCYNNVGAGVCPR